MVTPFPIAFSDELVAQAVRIQTQAEISQALHQLNLSANRPVLVVIGGASQMSQEDIEQLEDLFTQTLAPLMEELDGYVLDGGTDAGVMRLMGKAKAQTRAKFPLIGVCPFNLTRYPIQEKSDLDGADLEPHHTHFILVPGSSWGDESPYLAKTASVLSQNHPSVTLLSNGGSISLIDADENVKIGNPLIVIAGTGRLADEIASAIREQEQQVREKVVNLIEEGKVTLFDLKSPPSELSLLLRQMLSP